MKLKFVSHNVRNAKIKVVDIWCSYWLCGNVFLYWLCENHFIGSSFIHTGVRCFLNKPQLYSLEKASVSDLFPSALLTTKYCNILSVLATTDTISPRKSRKRAQQRIQGTQIQPKNIVSKYPKTRAPRPPRRCLSGRRSGATAICSNRRKKVEKILKLKFFLYFMCKKWCIMLNLI